MNLLSLENIRKTYTERPLFNGASFYLNENGEVVICFNEGDVAPMSMGCVTFVIPNDVLADIRR